MVKVAQMTIPHEYKTLLAKILAWIFNSSFSIPNFEVVYLE